MTSGSCRRIERNRFAKLSPICRLYLDLVDAGQLILDRIFDSYDIARHGVQLQEARIKRRRLAAAGRPGHQNHAVWQIEGAFDPFSDIGRQTELCVVELDSGPVENAQDNLFAVQRGDRRHPEIDLVAAHRQLDSAVLRQPALGNVEPRHDLDA